MRRFRGVVTQRDPMVRATIRGARLATGKHARSRCVMGGTLDALHLAMSDTHQAIGQADIPLDFTQFLSHRLGLETSATLSVLGSYLLSFEPQRRYPRQGGSARVDAALHAPTL